MIKLKNRYAGDHFWSVHGLIFSGINTYLTKLFWVMQMQNFYCKFILAEEDNILAKIKIQKYICNF